MKKILKTSLILSAIAFVFGGGVFLVQAQESSECEYLEYPIIAGEINNVELVTKLQYFLKTIEGQDVVVTGVYDNQTISAVNAFQVKYAKDILTPWGLTKPTGDVSVTTLHKINDLLCGKTKNLTEEEFRMMKQVQQKYGVIDTDTATTSSTTQNYLESIIEGQNGRLSGTPIGFVNEFSLPILITLFVLLTTQIYFMWGVAPRRRVQLIPREFK